MLVILKLFNPIRIHIHVVYTWKTGTEMMTSSECFTCSFIPNIFAFMTRYLIWKDTFRFLPSWLYKRQSFLSCHNRSRSYGFIAPQNHEGWALVYSTFVINIILCFTFPVWERNALLCLAQKILPCCAALNINTCLRRPINTRYREEALKERA